MTSLVRQAVNAILSGGSVGTSIDGLLEKLQREKPTLAMAMLRAKRRRLAKAAVATPPRRLGSLMKMGLLKNTRRAALRAKS